MDWVRLIYYTEGGDAGGIIQTHTRHTHNNKYIIEKRMKKR
jgi:hypothetical protein